MNPIVLVVALVVLAFVVGRAVAPYTSRAFGTSHVEFILIGVFLGPFVSPVLMDQALLETLRPLVSLLLGLLAFFLGLGLRDSVRNFEVFAAGAFAACGVIAVVTAATATGLQFAEPEFFRVDEPLIDIPVHFDGVHLWLIWLAPEALWISLALGAAAAVSSTSVLAWARARGYGGPNALSWVDGLATAGHVAAIAVFGIALAGAGADERARSLGLTIAEWAVISAAAGIACGVLFGLFIGDDADKSRVQLATVGAVTFAAGVGDALGVSPLFVNLAAGALVGFTSGHAVQVREAMNTLIDPVVILIMLFAGTFWQPPAPWVFALAFVYFVARWLARLVFTRVAVDAFASGRVPSQGIGNALISQGALAGALAVGFAQQSPRWAPVVTTTILTAMLVAQLLGRRGLRRYLVDAGDDALHGVPPRPLRPKSTNAAPRDAESPPGPPSRSSEAEAVSDTQEETV